MPTPTASRERLIVFTRYPAPGRVKSRLAAAIGDDQAARVHREMAERAVAVARMAGGSRGADVEVRIDGADPRTAAAWLGTDLRVRTQEGEGLGERMEGALFAALAEGAARAVLVGTDLPGLTAAILTGALDALAAADAVIGPAADGGYYLVGLTRPAPSLFTGIDWGTADVLAQTLAAAQSAGLVVALAPTLADVDRPEVLWLWEAVRRKPPE